MSQTDTDKVQQEGNMASSSVKHVNDPRQQQHTQPSTPPSFSATMAAAAADHSEAAVSGEEMDDASFFNLTPSPDKSTTTKRAASEPPTKPLRFKSPAGTPKARSRQSSPAPAAGKSHNKSPTEPLWGNDPRHERLTTITTLDEVRQQLVNDAKYMPTLKTGIEKMFEAVAASETQHEEHRKL